MKFKRSNLRGESEGDESEVRSLREDSVVSKRLSLDCCSHGRPAKRHARQRQPRRHLYLLLDDWERGYSVYRVGEHDFVDDSAGVVAAPPLVRLEAQHPYSWFFAAHGTKILAMEPSTASSSTGIPVFDVEALGVTVCPCPKDHEFVSVDNRPLYVSAGGGRLLALHEFHVDVLGPAPSMLATGCVVHPDGRTVFVSVKGWKPTTPESVIYFQGKRSSTFALDMERLEWTFVGEWLLPFRGRGYYDHELDTWVGLCLEKGARGCVCSCDVLPAGDDSGMPAWKLGKGVFFDEDCDDRHLGATLVYMGGSRFCIAVHRAGKDDDSYPRLREVRMTSFVLKYDKVGDLRTTRHWSYASMPYQIAHQEYQRQPNPVAFWM
ncbi:hypothetical protein ACP4OV_026335 [Aristida adscensionis]